MVFVLLLDATKWRHGKDREGTNTNAASWAKACCVFGMSYTAQPFESTETALFLLAFWVILTG